MKKPKVKDFQFTSDYEKAMEEYEQQLIDAREERRLEKKANKE